MRVLTSYSDHNGKVKMMCLGHVLLEEHTPHGLGNHAVIITEPNKELMMRVKDLLEELHYVGFPISISNTTEETASSSSLRSIQDRAEAIIM